MITVDDLSLQYSGAPLFSKVNLQFTPGNCYGIIGANGAGKSTFLRILSGDLEPTTGEVIIPKEERMSILKQDHFQYDAYTVLDTVMMGNQRLYDVMKEKDALYEKEDFTDEDGVKASELEAEFAEMGGWEAESDVSRLIQGLGLSNDILYSEMSSLTAKEKVKVLLAQALFGKPDIILLDEPTNHLDTKGRTLLYEFIHRTNSTIIVVSHDRTLLNMLSATYEMSPTGMRFYPMSYREYKETVNAAVAAKVARLQNQQKELAKAERLAHKTMERQQKHASRGEKQSAKQCVARIAMGNLRNRSEVSTSRLNKAQQEKLQDMHQELNEIRKSISESTTMKINIGNSNLPDRKRLVEATDVTYRYDGRECLWQDAPLNLSIYSGERIWLQGDNGSGKSTLLKLVTGILRPADGEIWRSNPLNILYLDQEYSCIDGEKTVYGLLEACNTNKPEHELKMLLNRFQFPAPTWDKKCASLSGGERMKLALCRLLILDNVPDMIIADEPTNNIDISSMDILAETLKSYKGTLLIVSHDEQFVHDIGFERILRI